MGAQTGYTGAETDVGTAMPDCTREAEPDVAPAEPIPPLTIRVSVFFDGTGNNMYNTLFRSEHPIASHLLHGPYMGDSYDNSYSNVARLERNAESVDGADHFVKIYVPGIGTVVGGSDDAEGTISGTGDTGVKPRVNWGFNEVISRVSSLITNPDRDVTLFIDAFGFSRGAAAARYFCYQVMEHEDAHEHADGQTLQMQLCDLGYNISSLQIKFAGIFDTVGAYGGEHADDRIELHLDAIVHASQALHLIAADEHRMNFPITNMRSKGNTEVHLPGVHSDIGGGYPDDCSEELEIYQLDSIGSIPMVRESYATRLQLEKDRLMASGLYTESEITLSWNALSVNRTGIHNQYSYIPLHIMAGKATDNGIHFNGNLQRDYEIPAELNAVNTAIQNYCASCAGGGSNARHWDNNADVNAIRNRYFHFSAFYNWHDGLRPQFHSTEHGWGDSNPARMGGVRLRRFYNG